VILFFPARECQAQLTSAGKQLSALEAAFTAAPQPKNDSRNTTCHRPLALRSWLPTPAQAAGPVLDQAFFCVGNSLRPGGPNVRWRS